MSDLVVDSSVVAKWLLPEADSAKAQQLVVETAAARERLIVLDLVFPEVANAIWKRHRQQLIDLSGGNKGEEIKGTKGNKEGNKGDGSNTVRHDRCCWIEMMISVLAASDRCRVVGRVVVG